MGTKRFRIAFSFAGEKRDFVEKVAGLLAHSFGKEAILYDKLHEAEFSRARLGRYLPKLYHEQSDLVVVVICCDYASKEWCGLEWDAIFDMLKQRRESEVMLSRFDNATVDGLYDAGYSDLDYKTPEQFAALILERLAFNEGKSKDYYTKPSSAGGNVLPIRQDSLKDAIPQSAPPVGQKPERPSTSEPHAIPDYGALIRKVGHLLKHKASLAEFQQILGEPTTRGPVMYSTSGNIRKRDLFKVGKITINLGSSPKGTFYEAKNLGDRGWFVWQATAWVNIPEGHRLSPAEIGSNIEWFAAHDVDVEYIPVEKSAQEMLLIHIPE